MNFERLRVKPADWHPRWWDRPVTLLLVLVSWYMVVDGFRMLAVGHWWGVYAFVVAPCTVMMMRFDVALQRASERDRAAARDERIGELESELGIGYNIAAGNTKIEANHPFYTDNTDQYYRDKRR